MRGLSERFGMVLGFGGSSLLLFSAAQVVNRYREPWLGIEPGNAAQNFSFNLSLYLPAIFLSSLLALTSAIFYVRSLRRLRRNNARPSRWEWATILPAVPVLILDGLLVLFIARLVATS